MYDGNALLRGPNEKIAYTREMQEEIIKCMNDAIYFGENYGYIISTDEGKVLIKLWEFQKRMLKAMIDPPLYMKNGNEDDLEKKRHVICLCPRQQGKCVCKKEKIKVKNKNTGEIKEIEIGEFHQILSESR